MNYDWLVLRKVLHAHTHVSSIVYHGLVMQMPVHICAKATQAFRMDRYVRQDYFVAVPIFLYYVRSDVVEER